MKGDDEFSIDDLYLTHGKCQTSHGAMMASSSDKQMKANKPAGAMNSLKSFGKSE